MASVELVATYRACAACGGFGFVSNTAAFDVFFWLQVTNFDVSLFHSAPNGPDHTHVVIFVLCVHDPDHFVATFAFSVALAGCNAGRAQFENRRERTEKGPAYPPA